jgi:hypothetical protein
LLSARGRPEIVADTANDPCERYANISVWITLMPSLRNTSSNAALKLCISVVDQEPCPFEQSGEAEVARLLNDLGAGRVGGAASEVDATAPELDEEEHVVAAQCHRLDGKEIARQHARRLLRQEFAPLGPTRRGSGFSPAASRSRRTVLGETWTPSFSSSPLMLGEPRGEKGAIGCSKRRTRLLTTKYRKLMPQNEQLDVLGEVATAATQEQAQQCREREIGERSIRRCSPISPSRSSRTGT